MTTDGPILAGIEVVVVGSALAADLATMVLADNGAAVTRIEPPGGDPRRASAAWRMWNRGAGSVVLAADSAADRSRLAELVAGADVLIETGWPDELAAWGLDAIAAPALVRCRISAFGRLGELARLPPYDGVVEARSGIMVDLGKAMGQRGQPTYRARPNPSYAAAMVSVQSIAAALLVRARDGLGQVIDTSLYGATLAYDFGSSLRRQSALGLLDPAIPAFTGSPEPFLPYLVCRCRDGQWMQITNNTARLFRHWMTVIGLGHIYDDPRYAGAPFRFDDPTAKREVAELILAAMLTRTFDEWLALFVAEGLTGDRFLTTQQALDHEQVVHNGTVLSVDDPVLGSSLQLGPLVRFEASPSAPGTAAPVLDGGRAVVRDRVPVAAASGRPASEPSPADSGPLAGLMILDFASWLAGPFGTSLLADMGARVIKIEPPQGDDARWALDGRARTFQGKESLALDLKTPEGAEVVARLLARADGLMHNMRGDASARLGIDYEKASAINPSIVYLYAGSYGSTGPGAGRAAFHPMMGALSGGVMRQLGRGNEPASADVELDAEQLMRQSLALSRANETSPDITGALGVATAMSLALLHRQRTGHGQYVETTMLASNLYICSEDAIRFVGQPPLPLVDADLRGTSALNRLYRTADGWLFLSCPTDAEWNRFAAAAGYPRWVDDPRFTDATTRVRFDDQLVAEIAIALAARSAEEWEKRLVGAQVAGVRADAGPGEDFFLSDPHSIENGFVVLGQHSGVGRYRRAGPAAHFARTPGAANVSHAFGQDGPAILAELGYDQATIDRWRDSKILIT